MEGAACHGTREGHEDGIPNVPQCLHAVARPDHPAGSQDHLPAPELESVAECLLAGVGQRQRSSPLLSRKRLEAEVRMPRPDLATSEV